MIDTIKRVHAENFSVYGVRKMWKALLRAGHTIGRDRVARLMRAARLRGIIRGGHKTVTTRKDDAAARFPDLVKREWDTGITDRIWTADFTYVWTYEGFCYVSFITDAASRRVLGWRASMSKETRLVTDALQQALSTRKRKDATFTAEGLIHHSDAGSQYTSLLLNEQLREAGIAGSIGTVPHAYDNALQESAIGLYKSELIDIDQHAHLETTARDRDRHSRMGALVQHPTTTRQHRRYPPIEWETNHNKNSSLELQTA